MAKLGAKAGWNENYVQSITASTTLVAGDSGKVFTEATDALVITLPACEAGLKFTFVNTGSDGNNIITPHLKQQMESGVLLPYLVLSLT